jgi:hypothetical protein
MVPTESEVRTFLEEEHLAVDPVRFWNHYEANGWKVGPNAMKNWRAAARTWARNGTRNGAPPSPPPGPDVSTMTLEDVDRAYLERQGRSR